MKASNIMGYLESREMWHHVKEGERKACPWSNYPCVMRSQNVFYTLEDKFAERKMDIDLECIVNKFPMPQIP